MRKIDRAIERSSLGTKTAKQARRQTPRATAAKVVSASAALRTTPSKRVGGKG